MLNDVLIISKLIRLSTNYILIRQHFSNITRHFAQVNQGSAVLTVTSQIQGMEDYTWYG